MSNLAYQSMLFAREVHKNQVGAEFMRIMRGAPNKLVFIGSHPEFELQARQAGIVVEVLPAGSTAPTGVAVLIVSS